MKVVLKGEELKNASSIFNLLHVFLVMKMFYELNYFIQPETIMINIFFLKRNDNLNV